MAAAIFSKLGVSFHHFLEIPSTNTYLLDILATTKETSCFHVCTADHQSAGRGQRGRKWLDIPGKDVAVSVGANLYQKEKFGLLSIRAGLSIASLISSLMPASKKRDVFLKWPNDIYIQNAKVGGILVETVLRCDDVVTVVVGAGVNLDCNRKIEDNRNLATFLDLDSLTISKKDFIELVALQLLKSLEIKGDLSSDEVVAWHSFDLIDNCMVKINFRDKDAFEGIAKGINQQGMLRVQSIEGMVRYFAAGDIEFNRLR